MWKVSFIGMKWLPQNWQECTGLQAQSWAGLWTPVVPQDASQNTGLEVNGDVFPSHGRILSILNFSPIKQWILNLLVTATTFLVSNKTDAQMQTLIWKTQKQASADCFVLGMCVTVLQCRRQTMSFVLAESLGIPKIELSRTASQLPRALNLGQVWTHKPCYKARLDSLKFPPVETIEGIFIIYALPIPKKDLGRLPTRIHPSQPEVC